jgi:hypothetical protein
MLTPLAIRPVRCLSIVLLLSVTTAHADLTHRFSFSDGAKDSVGNVTGQPKGAGAGFANGALVLKNADTDTGDKISFLEFSAPVLPKTGNTTTLVVWFTAKDTGGFARIINFGASADGEGQQFIYFSPKTGDGMARVAITGSDVGSKTYIDSDPLDDGKPHMVAIVIDGTAKKLRAFVDGKEPQKAEDLGNNTLDKVKPVENWLGKSSFINDPGLTATIDELRVYDTALSLEDAAAAFKAGPDKLPDATTPATSTPTPAAPASGGTSAPAPAAAPSTPAAPASTSPLAAPAPVTPSYRGTGARAGNP